MSDGMNKCILFGYLGADPELRFTQGGQAVLNMRLATTESYLDKDKNRQERTDWHTVVCWGRRAEGLAKILAKGHRILVEGKIRTSSYDDRDGNKRYKVEIIATDVFLAGGGARDANGGAQDHAGAAPAQNTGAHAAQRKPSGPVASAADLDGQYGDPKVKFKPRNWDGDDFVGSSFSACSADFLDVLAEALEYSASNPKAGKEKYADYDRKDAARARGWAQRIRGGGGQAAPQGASGGSDDYGGDNGSYTDNDDEIPF